MTLRLLGDRTVDLVGNGVGEVDRRGVGLDDDVDLIEVQAMWMLWHEPEGAREVRRVLDDQQPVRIRARPVQLVDRGARVQ